MEVLKTIGKKIVISFILLIVLGPSIASAELTPKESESAKYLAIYAKDTLNIGTSWRLYVRPRNGACLEPTNTGFQSPVNTPGQNNGIKKSASFHDGKHNCGDEYKSYISVDVPSAEVVHRTYVNYASPTYIGAKIDTTKNSGYQIVIFVIPMFTSDGLPDPYNCQVMGVSFK
ncbi:MAG: hypothetical protein ACH350_00355 [Parachlamydiaceae bacterium]